MHSVFVCLTLVLSGLIHSAITSPVPAAASAAAAESSSNKAQDSRNLQILKGPNSEPRYPGLQDSDSLDEQQAASDVSDKSSEGGENGAEWWDDGESMEDGGAIAISKKKWGDQSMQVWGKRGAKQGSQTRGSRFDVKADRKRKWGPESSFQAWGKRSVSNEAVRDHDAMTSQHHHSVSKRSLGDDDAASSRVATENLLQSLYKRAQARVGGLKQALALQTMPHRPIRDWSSNTMRVWGRSAPSAAWAGRDGEAYAYAPNSGRDGAPRVNDDSPVEYFEGDEDEDEQREGVKRSWSGDNGLRVWG